MTRPGLSAIAAAALLVTQCLPAHADNQMGYTLVTDQQASSLPRNHGALGLEIERLQRITDGGLTFDIIRVKGVRPGSPGARAGFNTGDELIAVDGRVFASLVAFAGYVGSITPGTRINVDYIPNGGGPAQAQRVAVIVGGVAAAGQAPPPKTGLSTGEKVAIGVGAAALIGCYEMGCFSHRAAAPGQPVQPQGQQQQPGYQQQPQYQQR